MTASAWSSVAHPDRLYIAGEWVAPAANGRMAVTDSNSEEIVAHVAEATAPDIARAVQAAREAFDTGPWPRLTHAERAQYLRAFADRVRARTTELSQLWSSEAGVVNTLARTMITGAAGKFDMYADLAETFTFTERHTPTAGGAVGLLAREPVGVVAAILPWNSPTGMIAYKTAPALLAGCTVILKSSPDAPGEAYLMAQIADEIELPAGVLNVVTADRIASELLVRDHRVDKITFTGSTAAGRRIGAIAGERIARQTLELGGKSAAVVCDDIDLQTAATSLAEQACTMTGQVCAALTRIVVGAARHDDMVDALAASLSNVIIGDPLDPRTGMGPLASRRQLDTVSRYIAQGVSDGATLAAGGQRPADIDRGYFVSPTVFANVDNSSTIAQEEIFGPVVAVIPARDETDAIRIANDTQYGLNASVYTDDADRAYRIARQLRSGTVGHNARRVDFGIAFGGFKQSGIGREGGREGLLPFLETKTIILDAEPQQLNA